MADRMARTGACEVHRRDSHHARYRPEDPARGGRRRCRAGFRYGRGDRAGRRKRDCPGEGSERRSGGGRDAGGHETVEPRLPVPVRPEGRARFRRQGGRSSGQLYSDA